MAAKKLKICQRHQQINGVSGSKMAKTGALGSNGAGGSQAMALKSGVNGAQRFCGATAASSVSEKRKKISSIWRRRRISGGTRARRRRA
jgi:hypothetical protein